MVARLNSENSNEDAAVVNARKPKQDSHRTLTRLAVRAFAGAALVGTVWLGSWMQGGEAPAAAPTETAPRRAIEATEAAPAAAELILRDSHEQTSWKVDRQVLLCQHHESGPAHGVPHQVPAGVQQPDKSGIYQIPNYGLGHSPLWSPAGTQCYQNPWGQGDYVAPGRVPHVPEYRLRVDDELELIYRVTRDVSSRPYELNVGDRILIQSLTDPHLDREVVVQPDGTVTTRLLGQVRAVNRTIPQLREALVKGYSKYYKQPDVTVTPVIINSKLHDIINTVDNRAGVGGQGRRARVVPDGTIALPAIGSAPAQGLTLDELKRELDALYSLEVQGLEVTPILVTRAPRYIYVVGEVKQPGRYTLEGPTTTMQAISLAGGWNVGANLRQTLIFRRKADWTMAATCVDLWDPLYGNTAYVKKLPVNEIWLADSDIVVVPKMKMLVADDFIDLIFTRGIYGVLPFQGVNLNFAKLSTL